jgi:hypothetical protein
MGDSMGEQMGTGPVGQPDEPPGPDAVQTTTPSEDAKAFTEVGWFVLGVSTILGIFLGRDHGVVQVVRILAMPVLLVALVLGLRARRWGWTAAAAVGLTGAVGIQVSAT